MLSTNSGSLINGGAEASSSAAALPRKASAVPLAMTPMRCMIFAESSRSKVRMLPSSTASCGMILGASPPLNFPMVTTAGVFAAISLAVMVWSAR